MIYNIGRERRVKIADLKVGYRLLSPVRGYRGKILIHTGDILSLKHIEQIAKWEARPGEGRLSLYNERGIDIVNTSAYDERPGCDSDPYKAVSVQQFYDKHLRQIRVPDSFARGR